MKSGTILLLVGIPVVLLALVLLLGGVEPPDVEDPSGRGASSPDGSPDGPSPSEAGSGPDAESDTEAARDGPRLVVAVVDESGRALPGAGVVLLLEGEAMARLETDEAGEASLPAPGGEGEVVVLSGFAPPVRRSCVLEAGRLEIALPVGAVIEGRVLVGDEPPPEPLVLTAWSRERFSGYDRIGRRFPGEKRTWELRVRTGVGGSFALRGLPTDWRAFLVAPDGYLHVTTGENPRTIDVRAPSSGLVVRLRRLPVLTGRVVDPEGRASAGARVLLEVRSETGGSTMGPTADGEGRFRIRIERTGITQATLAWTDAEGVCRGERTIDPRRLVGALDLGDLPLPARREIELRVLGPDGAPVAGAWAVPAGAEHLRGGPSDASGRLVISVAATVEVLRVAALGLGTTTAAVSDAGGKISATLPGGNLLRVRVIGPSGEPARAVLVRVLGSAPLFEGREEGPDPLLVVAGASPAWGWERSDGREQDRYRIGDGGIVLSGLVPGKTVRIEAFDPLTESVLETREVALGAREHRELEIRLEQTDRPLVGRVTDPDGSPLDLVSVLATVEGGGARSVFTGADGRFRLDGLRVEQVSLRVERPGCVSRDLADLEIPAAGREIEIVLRPGRAIRLTVADTAGTPVPGLRVGARIPDASEPVEGLEQDPGTYLVEDLPAGPVTLFAEVAGRRFTVRADGDAGEARIVVPRTGSLAVRIPFPLEQPVSHRLRFVSLGAEPLEVLHDVGYDPAPERTVLVPRLFPGRYRVLLEVYVKRGPDGEEYDPVLEGPNVTVREGVRSEVELVK